ncbi:hypothetical protein [Deinococcus sp.]|uniref:hypothetical protein n=1 Tax=Deinococcus sp. TaxID=47478 RepID=UPI0025C189BA|nr:hypothetical protein [Deinococcus sp.]
MSISSKQLNLIKSAHANGHLDPEIARLAGVSLSTVKRQRAVHGLSTHGLLASRGKQGEELTAQAALQRGLYVVESTSSAPFDLLIQNLRVDVKTTMRLDSGVWRFQLPKLRPSFYNGYTYPKDYAADCDLIGLVALYPGHQTPDFYFFDSSTLPSNLYIRHGGPHEPRRNNWNVFSRPATTTILA